MKIYNTLTRRVEDFAPLDSKSVRIYSCGPTVYNHIHIGNLSSFIFADMLHRALEVSGYRVEHVMNLTDVDDKTIRASQEKYPNLEPTEALKKLTSHYQEIFLNDMRGVGNRVDQLDFIKATDSIDEMRKLIIDLHRQGFAYLADDGVYFSIEKYKNSGKTYGQLVEVTTQNTSAARINNDEYDKESVHDFALWKTQKDNEPAWDFELDGRQLKGRPGWHIECSAMSQAKLGRPFDIHTGGIDLAFPHHENEIAQSTAGADSPLYAKYFVHNEHLLVDGKKMSKSLQNFCTLDNIKSKRFDPLAFRLMVLQSHYRSKSNFTWEILEAAQNRLSDLRAMADVRWQLHSAENQESINFDQLQKKMLVALQDDLNTPAALVYLSSLPEPEKIYTIDKAQQQAFQDFLSFLDQALGLDLTASEDISSEQKALIAEREKARLQNDWQAADLLRAKLKEQGIKLRDTEHGTIWQRA